MTLDLATHSYFWYQKHKQQKKKIDKLDIIKIKTFCVSKDIIMKVKKKNKPTTYGIGKVFTNHISDKCLVSRIHKELLKLINNKTYSPVKNKRRTWRGISPDTQMANKHMGKYSTSFVIKEMKIKTTLGYHFNLNRVDIKNKTEQNRKISSVERI